MATSPTTSKIIVVAIVLTIIGGTFFWVFSDRIGEKGIDPKKAKAMAKTYEKTCLVHLKTKRACKKHIGRHHRSCLKVATRPPSQGDELLYDAAQYEACMEKRRVSQVGP